MRAAVALVLALLAPSALGIDIPLLPQDDAGSGGDAGDVEAEAVRIVPGAWYEGRLVGASTPVAGTRVGGPDSEDWYVLTLPGSVIARITLELNETEEPDRGVFVDAQAFLYEPGGIFATGVVLGPGLTASARSTITSTAGEWHLQVYAQNRGTGYRFRVDTAPAPPGAGAFAGPGVAVFAIEPGTTWGGLSATSWMDGDNRGTQVMVPVFRGSEAIRDSTPLGFHAFAESELVVGTPAATLDLYLPNFTSTPSGYVAAGQSESIPPDATAAAVIAVAEQAYTYYVPSRDVGPRITLDHLEPASHVVRITQGQFDRDLALVAAPAAGFWSEGNATFQAERGLVFHMDCMSPPCHATGPDGVTRTWGYVGGPGRWDFHVGESEVPESFAWGSIVVGADLTLPAE